MKYARAVNNVVVDVTTSDPAGSFHPDIASQFVQVPEEVQPGWRLTEGGDWVPPNQPQPDPDPGDVPSSLTRIQFASAAFSMGIIDESEAEEWAGPGTLPALVASYINTLPAEQRPYARIRFRGAQLIERDDPFILALAEVLNLEVEQVDDLFRLGGTF